MTGTSTSRLTVQAVMLAKAEPRLTLQAVMLAKASIQLFPRSADTRSDEKLDSGSSPE